MGPSLYDQSSMREMMDCLDRSLLINSAYNFPSNIDVSVSSHLSFINSYVWYFLKLSTHVRRNAPTPNFPFLSVEIGRKLG